LELRLLIFVSTFAFLLASFPARNSDLWMHLASGRRIVEGHYPFGADSGLVPWLYDLICYVAYASVGGTGLVVLKALLVVGIALVIWRLSRLRGGLWLSALGTILALVAMGPRLLVQPGTVSYLLFAVCLWIVLRRADDATSRPSLLSGPLVVLFVVWANIDSGFIIALATIALIRFGQFLDDAARVRSIDVVREATSWTILAAVCLLNPVHIHAFAPPAGWLRAAPAWSSAVPVTLQAAYFALLGLGLLAFVLNLRRWRWQRILPWLGLAVVSVLQVRLVPFFALVAGPLLAWNVQEIIAATRAPRTTELGNIMPHPPRRFFRVPAVLAGSALLVCVWPGWLVGPPYEPRRWAVETAPSLQRAAEAVRAWHQEGRLGAQTRALHLSHETAHAFAWFCPQENGVLDERLASAIFGTGGPRDWPEQMRLAGINHVVVYDADRARGIAPVEQFLADSAQWPLLHLEGDLAIFGWRDPARSGVADLFRDWELDLNRLAFRPAPEKRAPPTATDQEQRHWWDVFWKPAALWRTDAEEARLRLVHAHVLERQSLSRHTAAWQAVQSAGLVAAAGAWTGPGSLIDIDLRLGLHRSVLPQTYLLQRDDIPPGLLYLAIRAARRALTVNPDDAQAHFTLGECYLRLLNRTRERSWAPQMSQLKQLRLAQASVALNRALALNPDLAQAHQDLAYLYREMEYADLALQHMRAHARLIREAGPPPDMIPAQFREQQARSDEELRLLGRGLEKQQRAYATESAGARILDRAMFAMKRGLARKALEMLLESDVAAFGAQGMALELELLLMTGRANDVRMWTDPTQAPALGMASYHWLRARARAALGEYKSAEEECALTAVSGRPSEDADPRQQMALMIGRLILAESSWTGSVVDLIRRATVEGGFLERVEELADALRREANATVIRGLLALEEGEVGEAEAAFRAAQTLWQDDLAVASGRGLDFKARIVAQGYLELIK
jgi:hypothetical protein